MKNPVSFLRLFFPLAFILVLAATVALSWRLSDVRPLSNEALNCAQIARKIAQGHGFSTDILQEQDDLAVFSKPFSNAVPELGHAPLYPTILATVFSVWGEGDGVVTATSLAFFVFSAVLLFVLARRLLGQTALALIIAAVYAVSLSALAVAHSGQPQALGTCLLLWLLLALTPKTSDVVALAVREEAEDDLFDDASPKRRLSRHDFGIGMLAALCYLNDYLSIFLFLPLLFLWRPRETRARGWIFAFALGFTLMALPWWIRNARLTGNPLYSTEWLLLAGQAGTLREWLIGLPGRLSAYLSAVSTLPHLLLAPFIVVSLWIRPQNVLLGRREMAILLALLSYIAALGAFNHNDSSKLMPFAALLTFVGLVTFHQILSNAWQEQSIGRKMVRSLLFEPSPDDPTFYEAIPNKTERFWRLQGMRLRFLALLRLPLWLRKSDTEETLFSGKWSLKSVFETRSAFLLLTLLSVPLLGRLAFSQRATPSNSRAALAPLTKVVPKNRVVVTDAPEAIAWYGHRKAVFLPEQVMTVVSPESSTIGALYLTGQPLRSAMQQWKALYQGVEVPGYQRATTSSQNALYLRQPSLQESQREAKANPQNAAVHNALGQLLLQSNQAQNALRAFAAAQRLQPKLGEAYMGAGFALLSLKNLNAARKQFTIALRLAPRSLPALMGMAQVRQAEGQTTEAIALYERVLADYPEHPVALNNLANLYADQKNNLYRALEMARRAVARNPNNASMLDTLGWTCFRLGYRAEALRYLQQAAKLAPNNRNISSHLKQVQSE